ncbi:MAG TPA: hypothetical protein DCP91_09425 [Eggerthellaceae bacterium]|nr:hypothetical protein [Eggerthellaceae bacterium]
MKLGLQTTSGIVYWTQVKNLSFAPTVDVTSATLPVNRFTAEVKKTDRAINLTRYLQLMDDSNRVYCKYRVVMVEELGRGWQRVTCESLLGVLDRSEAGAKYFDGSTTAYQEIESVLQRIVSPSYVIDSSLAGIDVQGFAPRQTYRERLQWLLMASGAFFYDTGDGSMHVAQLTSAAVDAAVPLNRTFWRPKLEQRGLVTRIKVTAYTVSTATPAQGDDSVEDEQGNVYRVRSQEMTLDNPSATSADAENVVTVDNVMLVNQSNAAMVMQVLAARYFQREELVFDCVNNRDYHAGGKYSAFFDEEHAYSGMCESTSFSFGLQNRSTMRLVGTASIEVGTLTVIRMCGSKEIGRKKYQLPVGAPFEIENPWIEKTVQDHRYVYRPLTASVTGVVASGGTTVTAYYAIALDKNNTTGVLKVVSVDALTIEGDDLEVVSIS